MLQYTSRHVQYIIIVAFSVFGQIVLFGWIDRRFWLASGLMGVHSDGFLVILVGDIAQLQPVTDKPLYKSVPDKAMSVVGCSTYRVGCCAYRKLEIALFHLLEILRNGECTFLDWELPYPAIYGISLKVIWMIAAFTWHIIMKEIIITIKKLKKSWIQYSKLKQILVVKKLLIFQKNFRPRYLYQYGSNDQID